MDVSVIAYILPAILAIFTGVSYAAGKIYSRHLASKNAEKGSIYMSGSLTVIDDFVIPFMLFFILGEIFSVHLILSKVGFYPLGALGIQMTVLVAIHKALPKMNQDLDGIDSYLSDFFSNYIGEGIAVSLMAFISASSINMALDTANILPVYIVSLLGIVGVNLFSIVLISGIRGENDRREYLVEVDTSNNTFKGHLLEEADKFILISDLKEEEVREIRKSQIEAITYKWELGDKDLVEDLKGGLSEESENT